MRKISYNGDLKNAVQVVGRNVPISRKIGREIAVFIKGKYVDRAIAELERVAKGELAVPYKRHNRDTPHRKGSMMSGRFPLAASLQVIKLLKSLKANAENKALSEEDIFIVHAACQHAGIAWHYGRLRGRKRKLAHFELVGVEKEREDKEAGFKKKTASQHIEKPSEQTPSAIEAERPPARLLTARPILVDDKAKEDGKEVKGKRKEEKEAKPKVTPEKEPAKKAAKTTEKKPAKTKEVKKK